MRKEKIGKRTKILVMMLVISSVCSATTALKVNATDDGGHRPVISDAFVNSHTVINGGAVISDSCDGGIVVQKTVTINCGSITINTGVDPDICICVPIDRNDIDVGNGAMVRVEVSYSIKCPGWDDTGYVDIKFEGTTNSASAQSGETKTGTLTISKDCNPSETFVVTLHAKLTFTIGGMEDTKYSHCSTAAAPPDPDPVLQLTPTEHQFPDTVQHYASAEYSFTLKNIGTGTARGSIYINGNDPGDFTITRTSTGSTTFAIDRDASITIYIEFIPQSQGWKTATLTADGSNCNDVASSLTGQGKVV